MIRCRTLVLAVVVLAAVAPPPAAAQEPGDEFAYEYAPPDSAEQGTAIAVSGTCRVSGAPADYAFWFMALRVGQPGAPYDFSQRFPVGDDARFAGDLLVPADAPPGRYSFSAHCVEGGDAAYGLFSGVEYTITGEYVPPSSTTSTTHVDPTSTTVGATEELPRTGGKPAPAVMVALVLVTTGMAVIGRSRMLRRRLP